MSQADAQELTRAIREVYVALSNSPHTPELKAAIQQLASAADRIDRASRTARPFRAPRPDMEARVPGARKR